MTPSPVWIQAREWAGRGIARPDFGRATRATVAVMVPLLASSAGWMPFNVTFTAFAAQSVAIVDVRGAYTLRLGLLLTMTAILTGATQLGEAVNNDVMWAVLSAGLVAILGGVWRHVLPDYGTSLAISSTLLFVVSVNSPAATTLAGHHSLGALVGGLWGVVLQVANWPIRPQHPLRRAVSDSWAAVADLFEALGPGEPSQRSQRVHQCEVTLRTTLDHAYAVVSARRAARITPLRVRLQELNLGAARLSTRVVALNTALEDILADPEAAWFWEALQPLLASLTNTARSVAVALVSRQPAHFATCEVRLHRLANLLHVFQAQTMPRLNDHGTIAQLQSILRQIEQHLPETRESLRATVDPADERAAFSLELFDLHTWTLRPLASALVLDRRVDSALVRFTARVAVLMMLGVAAFKLGRLPHGYWLPLSMVIVLQPDYGTTRQRAGERALGTFAGSVAASLLLWLQLPFAVLATATATTIFSFAYFLKHNYTLAVFFITLMVVLLTEAHAPVNAWFTVERLGSTLVGAGLALLATVFFWPVWERDRVPRILAAALEANRDYLRLIGTRFADGGSYDAGIVAAKRRAETANNGVFASLQRMRADPRSQQVRLEQVAALANGNQRVTRAFVVLALQIAPDAPVRARELAEFIEIAGQTLAALADALRADAPIPVLETHANRLRELISAGHRPEPPRPTDARERSVLVQIPRIATELSAMLLAANQLLAAPSAPAAITR